jgi:hypothetical protein
MISRTTRRFREMYAALPDHVQRQAREAYRILRRDPMHDGLHFKQVNADPIIYSARIGISYWAVCAREGLTLVWFWIGSHAEYDGLLSRL